MDKIYKLLRDNRQTGPFTLEELVQLGLKPFDLIWADRLTAGWMYPSEIDVLKPYLPEAAGEAVAPQTILSAPKPAAPAAVVEKQAAVPSSAKHIFISLPAGASFTRAAPVQKTPEPVTSTTAAAEEETPEQKLERKAVELRQKVQALAEAKKGGGEEPSLDTKYSRSLEDIKEEYSHWMHEQKHKGHHFPLTQKHWMTAALVVVLAFAGFGTMKWLSAPGEPATAQTQSQPEAAIPIPVSSKDIPKEAPTQTVINTEYSERNADVLSDLEKANRQIEADLKRIHTEKQAKATTHQTKKRVDTDIQDTYDTYEETPSAVDYESKTAPTVPSSNVPVRTASVRTEKKSVPLSQQIDIKAVYLWTRRNKGLSGLELALRNNSAQVLKTVAIDVFYYKDNRPVGKETVYFNNVPPGGSLTLTAPGNRRASSATYQLGLISSEGSLYVARQ